MSTKHTPGPWRLRHTGKHDGIRCLYASSRDICQIDGGPGDDCEQFSNARLIAAAPELLEALAEILEFAIEVNNHLPRQGERMEVVMAFRRNPGEIDVFKKARAAIAKATAE